MNVLITGGAGFIGSRLCEKLFDQGYEITILDNLSPQVHGSDSTLYNRIKEKCNFIKGDVRVIEDWKRALKDQDIVVHFAAETGTGQSMYEVQRYNDVNVMGTSNLLQILANSNHSIKKIILSSSRSIYGEGKYYSDTHGIQYPHNRKESDMIKGIFNPKCEHSSKEMRPLSTDENSKIHPISIYGMTKQYQEQMIMLISKSLGIPSVSLRYQNVYGPGQSLSNPYTGILSIFSTRILNGNDLEIYEDGLQSRDFVFIDDVVDATKLAIEKDNSNDQVFNVGSGEAINVKKVAEVLRDIYNVSNINISISGKFRLGDIRHNFADLSKINKLLGYSPKFSFMEGVSEFVKWVRSQEVQVDNYEKSIKELEQKGLFK